MDQDARHRSRGIRTIGRLASPAVDDVLLAQWPHPASGAFQRQDVAVGNAWTMNCDHLRGWKSREQGDPLALFDAYDRHQRCSVQRLLDAIEMETLGRSLGGLVYEAPSTSRQDILTLISAAEASGEMSATLADDLRARTLVAGEAVARLWGVVELFRSGMIDLATLQEKRDQIVGDLDRLPPLTA